MRQRRHIGLIRRLLRNAGSGAAIIVLASALCCGRSDGDGFTAYVRRNAACPDSLAALRTAADAADRASVAELLNDTVPEIRAAALYVSLSADSAAGYILVHRDREACRYLWRLYTSSGDSSARIFAGALCSRFDSYTADVAAQTVTGMFSADETARAMEAGDIELAKAVRNIYKENPETLAVYEQLLPSSILNNPGYQRAPVPSPK